MYQTRTFRFADNALNEGFIALLTKANVDHAIDGDRNVHYSSANDEVVENDLINAIRDRVFRSWQVLSCPKEWIERYRAYMVRHHIPFQEELHDKQVEFLIPGSYRPHSWKIEGPSARKRQRATR